jgi:hypothetical protein
MRSGGSGVKRDGGSVVKSEVVGAASKAKCWEQRQKRSGQSFYGCDDVVGVTYVRGNVAMHQPKVRTARLPTNPNLAPTPARPTTISNNPTTAPPPTPYHLDLYRQTCASIIPRGGLNLSLWTSLAIKIWWSYRLTCSLPPPDGQRCLHRAHFTAASTDEYAPA